MAKVNIPEELEALVQEYLTDGIITTKERLVLLKKAESLGVDVDEFDLYLDAQQQKSDQIADAAVRKAKGATCPFCGAPVPMLTDKCPECGQFITAEASAELKDVLESLESFMVDFKAGYDVKRSKAEVERNIRKAKLYYSNHPKVKLLLQDVEKEIQSTESKRKKAALMNSTVKNIWFWTICCFIAGFVFFEDKKKPNVFLIMAMYLLAFGICSFIFRFIKNLFR